MLNELIKVLCELTANVEALVKNQQQKTGGKPRQGRISSSISPVMKQDQQPIRLVNENPHRLGVIIQNSSEGELMIALDSQRISEKYYTFKLRAGETLHFDIRSFGELYKGGFMGLWDEATGPGAESKALVTEIFWSN
ncbi:MAG: hypothetical protein CL666_13825 [Balneola sp.]|nr:hypothetical protein [Balneola sp.]|tara:strand:- start:3722 stop:4135 length:414 start_codon:yes stop_codon:yes gene_type:complete